MSVANGGDLQQAMANGGEPRRGAASYSVADAAAVAGVPERTLRDWIRAGKVQVIPPAPPQRGARVPASAVETLRQVLAEDGELRREAADAGGDPSRAAAMGGESARPAADEGGPLRAAVADGDVERTAAEEGGELRQGGGDTGGEVELARLRARLEGALTAVRIHATRRTDADRELVFLRDQLVASRQAEEQMRVLLQASERNISALAALTEQLTVRLALPEPPRRPWWVRWWRR